MEKVNMREKRNNHKWIQDRKRAESEQTETGKRRDKATGAKGRFLKGMVALLTGLAVLCVGLFSDMTRIKDVRAAGAPIKTVKYIKWTKLYEMPQNGFFGMLMFEWGGNYYFSSGNSWGKESDHGPSWTAKNINVDPYISTGDVFYTKGIMDVPYFHYGGTDGDNKNARKYILEFYSGGKATGRYLDRKGGSEIQSNDWSSADWMTIMDKKRADEKGIGGYVSNGDNIIFWNKSGNDAVLRKSTDTNGNGCFCGVGSGGDADWDTNSRFWVYGAAEVEYSCIYGNWTMDDEQVYVAEDDLILMDGATMTIPAGSVLCVKGSFFVNGTIKCYGTILVEDGGRLIPFTPKKKGGDIDLDGGTLAVMSGGRVYGGNPKGYLNAAEDALLQARNGASIVNYGLLTAGRVQLASNSRVENHKNGLMFLGYPLATPGKFSNSYMGITMAKAFNFTTSVERTLPPAVGLSNTGGYSAADSTVVFEEYSGSKAMFGGSGNKAMQTFTYDY